MRAQTLILPLVLVALVAGFALWRGDKTAGDGKPPPRRAVTVEMTTARLGDAPVQLSAIGQIVSSHSVAVRPQVSGTLLKVLFTEGERVSQGDRLFEIDAEPYRAALAQAQAQLASAQAAVSAAEAQEQRLLPLSEKGYVTAQELLDAKAAAQQARASVQLASANLRSAQVNVDRTVIRAPISGRTGSLAVRSGNLLTASEATPLVTINQMQPVHAEFSAPQSQLAALQQALAAGPVSVSVSAQTGLPALAEGRLLFVDNRIDPATGTVKLKAGFANPDEALWPGSFASFTILLAVEKNQVLVPEIAVQPGADGSFVYVVDGDSKAQLTPVAVARQLDNDVVITAGLRGGERLVARAPRDLKPGATVQLAGAEPKPAANTNKARRAP